jgi:peroxiredoxin
VWLVSAGVGVRRPPDPLELVTRSQAVFAAPPPFVMTTRYLGTRETHAGTTIRESFDGTHERRDTLEAAELERSTGAYVILSADRSLSYTPADNQFLDRPVATTLLRDLTPSWRSAARDGLARHPMIACESWMLVGEDRVAGRVTDVVGCGEDRYWIDRTSGMLLKVVAPSQRPIPGDDFAGTAVIAAEVTELDLSPTFPPDLFAFVPPAGARDANATQAPPAAVLKVGEPAPVWTGRTIDGRAFSTDDLRGHPAALLVWCSCAAGPEARMFLEEARRRVDAVTMVLVSVDEEGTTKGLVDWLGATTPVVHDPTQELGSQWGVDLPSLVLLRADGLVAGVEPGRFESLTPVLDALAAGKDVPLLEPRPQPGLGPCQCALGPGELSSILEVGQVAPTLSGPRLGGGELSTADLRGHPAVVIHWWPPDAQGRLPDDGPSVEALLEALEGSTPDVPVVLVSHGEKTPGADAAYLQSRGYDVPVIFDWGGELFEDWGLVYWPTVVVLDADGRVRSMHGQTGLADPQSVVEQVVAAGG